jgi:hypothetical protein
LRAVEPKIADALAASAGVPAEAWVHAHGQDARATFEERCRLSPAVFRGGGRGEGFRRRYSVLAVSSAAAARRRRRPGRGTSDRRSSVERVGVVKQNGRNGCEPFRPFV